MQVETFECEEIASEHPECESAALELIEKLELDGQRELIAPTNTPSSRRCPYRPMTAEEELVYRTMCPTRTELKRYAASPIPLRVLQVAAHASELGFFDQVVVWHPEEVTTKDPVLVGEKKDPAKNWEAPTPFILARWGAALDEWPAMVRQATEKVRARLVDEFNEIVGKAKLDAERALTIGFDAIVKMRGRSPSYYSSL